MQNKKQYIIINNKKIIYKLNNKVFEPNLTTKLLIDSVIKNIKSKKNISLVDLGCGSGIVGLTIAKILNLKNNLFFSDLSVDAIFNTRENIKFFKKKAIVKQGSMFDPWKNNKFDIIINDISAISSLVSKISPWFKKIPCESGKDGTDLTMNFLKKLSEHTKKNSKIFFPILSLSNEKKIINYAKKKFPNLKCVYNIAWPLPESMNNHKQKLLRLKKSNYINFQIISGKIVCKTSVFMIKT